MAIKRSLKINYSWTELFNFQNSFCLHFKHSANKSLILVVVEKVKPHFPFPHLMTRFILVSDKFIVKGCTVIRASIVYARDKRLAFQYEVIESLLW